MRIIAGQSRGRKLKSVPGMNTRPTADRVKEAVFSSVEGILYGARVLDVFSGTGNIALEAVSRGASEAVLLEKNKEALKVIKENVAACGSDRCKVIGGDSIESLNLLGKQKKQFDFIYIDPPYKSDLYRMALQKIADKSLLAEDGIIIMECGKNTFNYTENSIFFIYKEKNYGDTSVVYLKYKQDEEEVL